MVAPCVTPPIIDRPRQNNTRGGHSPKPKENPAASASSVSSFKNLRREVVVALLLKTCGSCHKFEPVRFRVASLVVLLKRRKQKIFNQRQSWRRKFRRFITNKFRRFIRT